MLLLLILFEQLFTIKRFYRNLALSSSLLILISTIKYGKNQYLLDCANLIVLWLKSQQTINFVCFNKFNPYFGSFHLQNKMFNYLLVWQVSNRVNKLNQTQYVKLVSKNCLSIATTLYFSNIIVTLPAISNASETIIYTNRHHSNEK